MKTKANILAGFFLLLILSLYSQAQNFNRTVSANDVHHNSISDAWRFSINPGLGFVVNSHSIPGINANRLGTNLTGRKYFGNVGLGITGGIMAGNISNDAVSTFLSDRNYPADATVTKSNPSNSYLLFGPAVRFGKKVQFGAELSGGLFLNDAGSFTVTPLGAGRPIYSLENGNKNLFPGFSGNVHIDYPINKSTHFFISTGYLQTKSSNLILDIKQGIDIPKLQNQDLKLFTAGIGIRKSFGGRKGENSDGLSASTNGGYTAQNRGDIKYPRDASSGLPTGKRSYFRGNQNNGNTGTTSCGPVSLRTTNTDGSISEMTFACPQDAAKFRAHREPPTESYNPWEMDDDVEGTVMNPMIGNDGKNTSSSSSCGPVTIRTTNPDGTVTETTFACPQDAAQFQQRSSSVNSLNNSMPSRLSMTPTTAKQTQGETFGEPIKTSSQSRSILKNLPDSLKKNIIVGKVSRGADNVLGIETNQSIAEKSKPKEDTAIRQKQHADGLFRLPVNGGGPGGGPYVKVWSSDLLLPAVPKFYLTDSKTGNKEWMDDWQKPTVGKTSEAKNSLGAISRIQAPTVGKTSEAKNSLGAISRLQAPTAGKTSEVKNSTGETGYFDIEWPELKVSLLDTSSGTVLATTLTEPDGQFFFANLPSGTFAVRVEGSISTISQYDVTLNKKANFGGVIIATNENWSVELNTGTGTAEQAAAYVQKTRTKANNSNDRLMGNTND
ncbi:MAG: carboxypeptidase regulatory-like domain-containing protein, partial [Bacteroidetes bacterium]|nr:carboxypeptidase regulatory-like domain-containing protein [Bacteroidota bacterium]